MKCPIVIADYHAQPTLAADCVTVVTGPRAKRMLPTPIRDRHCYVVILGKNIVKQSYIINAESNWIDGKILTAVDAVWCYKFTGPDYKAATRFGELCSRCCLPSLPQLAYGILATWQRPNSPALYYQIDRQVVGSSIFCPFSAADRSTTLIFIRSKRAENWASNQLPVHLSVSEYASGHLWSSVVAMLNGWQSILYGGCNNHALRCESYDTQNIFIWSQGYLNRNVDGLHFHLHMNNIEAMPPLRRDRTLANQREVLWLN